jgi:hypothetical protein
MDACGANPRSSVAVRVIRVLMICRWERPMLRPASDLFFKKIKRMICCGGEKLLPKD